MNKYSYSIFNLLTNLWKKISKKRKKQFQILLLLMIISAFVEVFAVASVIPFLTAITNPNTLISQKYIQFFFNYFDLNNHNIVILTILIFAIGALTANGLKIITLKFNAKFGALVGNDLSNKIYSNYLNQSYVIQTKRNSSELITNVIRHIDAVTSVIIVSLQCLTAIIISISILFSLLIYDWKISLLLFLILSITYILIGLFFRRILSKNSYLVAKYSQIQIKTIQESLGSIRDIILENNQSLFINIFKEVDKPMRLMKSQNLFISGSPRFFLEATALSLLAGFSLLFVSFGNYENYIIVILGTFAFSAQRLLPSLQTIYSSWTDVKAKKDAIRNVCELLEKDNPNNSTYKNLLPHKFSSSIILKSIYFSYSDNSPEILKDINMEIKKGEIIGIRGITGSGKSTLVDLIMGLLSPSKGKVLIDGVDLTSKENYKKLVQWRKTISHVPQRIYLTDTTIAENIAFGLPNKKIDIERIKLAAKKANIYEFIKSCASGFNTLVGESGVKLSGGQIQRIGLARAFYKNSSFLVLDEATSSLDIETESEIMKSIKNLDKKLTILIIAHRLKTLSYCDRVYELKNGIISGIEHGSSTSFK
tara:strand:- start:181 stop:1962 length:1782 start_codon:yes stop_codon:yes gene_type:complete